MASKPQPEQRRTIVVLNDGDRQAILRDEELVDLLDDPEAQFISLKANGETTELVELLRSQGVLRPGTVVVQSPYNPDRYVSAEAALEEFTVEKFLILTQLAKLLGAKRVTFEDVRADGEKSSISAEAKGQYGPGSVESTFSRSLQNSLRQKLAGEHVFPGAAPDLDGARAFLVDKQLAGDPQLAALIDLRAGENGLVTQDVTFNGTRESLGNMAAVLRVAGGRGKLKIAGFSSDIAQAWESQTQVEVRTRIEF